MGYTSTCWGGYVRDAMRNERRDKMERFSNKKQKQNDCGETARVSVCTYVYDSYIKKAERAPYDWTSSSR